VVSAGASTTRYYLSADGTKGAGDTLIGSRPVPALAPNGQTGSVSIGSATVTVPSTVVPGTYHLLACGEDTNAVKEAIETNNCTSSTGTVQVAFPDLVETFASAPPASIQRGHTFSLTDTVRNQGAVSAGASTSRYYLSLDTVKGSGDTLLAGSRSVGILAGSASSSGTVSVTVPAGTVPNVYRVLACADDTLVVKEVNETNNCVDAGPLTVTP
jgi:subtilase family serine protease